MSAAPKRKPKKTQGKSAKRQVQQDKVAETVEDYRAGTTLTISTEELFQDVAEIKKRAFLSAFVASGSREHAARTAQCSIRSHHYWLVKDPQYADAFQRAEVLAASVIEEAMFQRAVNGVPRGVYWNGVQVAEERLYSDTAAIFLLKGLKGERYRERAELRHEISPSLQALTSIWQQMRDHPQVAQEHQAALLQGDDDVPDAQWAEMPEMSDAEVEVDDGGYNVDWQREQNDQAR